MKKREREKLYPTTRARREANKELNISRTIKFVLIVIPILIFAILLSQDTLSKYTQTISQQLTLNVNRASWDVVYHANDGTNTTVTEQQQYGIEYRIKSASSLNITHTTDTNTSSYTYQFNGWNSNDTGTETDYTVDQVYAGNAPLDLYAKWELTGAAASQITFTPPNTWENSNSITTVDGALDYLYTLLGD